jgi:hexokinase
LSVLARDEYRVELTGIFDVMKPMNVTWIMRYPTGQEKGRILTVDLGGTNIRVCDVCLSIGRQDFEQRQRKYKLPEEVKTSTKEVLWGFIADRIESFLKENNIDGSASQPLPLAFTFSFPVEQKSIRSGILQRWTKNFNVPGVVGQDVVPQLEEELAKRVSSHRRPGESELINLERPSETGRPHQ